MKKNSVGISNAKGIKLKEWDKCRIPLKLHLNIDHYLAFHAEGKKTFLTYLVLTIADLTYHEQLM